MQKKTKRRLTVALSAVAVLGGIFIGLEITTTRVKAKGAWRPSYEKASIEQTLNKAELTDSDYQFLYEQTGLTKLGVDGLLQRGLKRVILQIQEQYFSQDEIHYKQILPYVFEAKREGFGELCALEDGDIILSASTTAAGIRVGHAALVVDGENYVVLESLQIGYDSNFADAYTETEMSTYMVLRPTGIEESERKKVTEYAKNNLVGIPYNQIVGLIPKKYSEEITSTQCSHLCWYAYKKFGYDLDSNGGLFVAPKDLANSPYLEVVQIYGFDPEKLWK